ncbi:LamG-like jellyroll fold domain-containing protein [Echinimonas agarilytica]|uniref:FecR domain-containing protein n=1 Tax=Echinimonas agarilytica TaxID=1215918 RepID=A0AA42B7C6_9GAMM|nr:LamG-like jellyroll fold domain-containing protein [Echinimonas agarilytica]MCM2679765.1 FecR domain-containing protein [Echinimonas agarilytica]
MTSNSHLKPEHERLVAAYLSGEDVAEELLAECKTTPQLLTTLSEQVSIERLLAAELMAENDTQSFSSEVIERILPEQSSSLVDRVNNEINNIKAPTPWYEKPMAMAASIVMLVSILFAANYVDLQQDFAQVTKIAAVSPALDSLHIGNHLGRGEVELHQGYSEITLNNGVVLVLEAPIKLQLKSAEQVILDHGKLIARVPPNAIGFRIDTPSSEIIDLGTEFGVEVNQNGASKVHVLDGEIKARGNTEQSYRHAKKDEGLAFDLAHQVTNFKSDASEFMRVLPGNSALEPDYLHWSFNEQIEQQFPSTGQGLTSEQYPAIDRSPADTPISHITGVFDQAIEFDGQGNWLETNFPGIGHDDPRTVSFWLKIPKDFSINHAYGVVNWGLQQDYAAWQISPNPEAIDGPLGRLRIGTYQAQVVGSTDLRDDQWHHIAVVLYGGETSNIATHVLLYVDGELERTQNKSIAKIDTLLDHPLSRPLSLGRNIGYEDKAQHEQQMFFKGALDELYVHEAALSQQQIQQLMNQNKLALENESIK